MEHGIDINVLTISSPVMVSLRFHIPIITRIHDGDIPVRTCTAFPHLQRLKHDDLLPAFLITVS